MSLISLRVAWPEFAAVEPKVPSRESCNLPRHCKGDESSYMPRVPQMPGTSSSISRAIFRVKAAGSGCPALCPRGMKATPAALVVNASGLMESSSMVHP